MNNSRKFPVLACFILFVLAASAVAGEFGAAVNYSVGLGSWGVAVGDFNADGMQDLVVTNANASSVSVLLGKGDGTFRLAATYSTGTGTGPYSVVVSDFNGDGRADFAVATFGWYVTVFFGNGDGSFQPAVTYNGGAAPKTIAAADLNGDGKPDLVVADEGSNGVGIGAGVLLNNGDGTFQPLVLYSTASAFAASIGDYNSDGVPDIIVANISTGGSTVSVLLGNGNGTFRSAIDSAAGYEPSSVAVGDFNGDGKLDAAVVNNGGGLSVLLGNGNGTFQSPVSYLTGRTPQSVVVADVNADGVADIIVADWASGEANGDVSVLLGKGDGTFQTTSIYPADTYSESVAVGDFNSDGKPDLAVANFGANDVSVLLNLGAAPAVSLSASSLTFGYQKLGTTSPPQKVTLTNTGTAALLISSISISGDFLTKNTCASTVGLGKSCTITVQFRPRAPGTRKGMVSITDNAPNSPQTIQLTGTGIR